MANSNVISAFYGGTGRNQILSQTLAATTETEFKIGNDAGVTTNIAVLSMPTQGQILGSQSPNDLSANAATLNGGFSRINQFNDSQPPYNSGVFDNSHPFLLRIAGVITPASNAANTFTLKFYLGTSKSGTNICTTGATTGFETSVAPGGFIMESQLVWDSVSGTLSGQFWWNLNSAVQSYNTWKVNTATAAAAAVANLQFCASAQWGNAVGGVVAVSEFSLTQL